MLVWPTQAGRSSGNSTALACWRRRWPLTEAYPARAGGGRGGRRAARRVGRRAGVCANAGGAVCRLPLLRRRRTPVIEPGASSPTSPPCATSRASCAAGRRASPRSRSGPCRTTPYRADRVGGRGRRRARRDGPSITKSPSTMATALRPSGRCPGASPAGCDQNNRRHGTFRRFRCSPPAFYKSSKES